MNKGMRNLRGLRDLMLAILSLQSAFKDLLRDLCAPRSVRPFEKDQYTKLDLVLARRFDFVLFRRQSHKPSLSAKSIARSRGPGLAEKVQGQCCEFRSLRRPILDRTAHPFDQCRTMLRNDIQPGDLLREDVRIRALFWAIELWAVEVTAIDERRICDGQLDRCDEQVIAFAQSVADVPFSARQPTGRFIGRCPGPGPKPEAAESCVESPFAQTLADVSKIVV